MDAGGLMHKELHDHRNHQSFASHLYHLLNRNGSMLLLFYQMGRDYSSLHQVEVVLQLTQEWFAEANLLKNCCY
jgi:hypothetical protein